MSDGTQQLKIEIPHPLTQVKVGYRALAVGQDGFSAYTRGHVWLTALDGSTFSAHSQGALRMLSEEGSIYSVAKVGVTAATLGGTTIAAKGGVKIIAGHPAKPGIQEPEDSIGSPPAADDITDGCDTVAQAWTIADTVTAALFNVKAAGVATLKGPVTVRTFFDIDNVTDAIGFAAGFGLEALGGLSNTAAVGVNLGGLGGGVVSGVNLHAIGGINIATPAFCSIYGMAGLLFASPLTVQLFGAATTGVVGLASAGMSSLGKVDLASTRAITVEAGLKCEVSSDPGEVVLAGGGGATLGQVLPDPDNSAQSPTTALTLEAKVGMRLASPKGEVRIGRVQEDIPTETAASALTAAVSAMAMAAGGGSPAGVLKNGARAIEKAPGALKHLVQPAATDTTVTMANDVTAAGDAGFVATESITLAVGPWIVQVDADGVTLGMGTKTPPAGPEGVWTAPVITGPQVAMTADELAAKAGPAGGSVVVTSDAIEVTSDPMPGSVKIESDAIAVKDFSLVTFA